MTLPQRKHIRLKEYDYSQPGYYYVTLCTHGREEVLSKINVGRGLAPAECELSQYGKIVEEQLRDLEKRYKNVLIDKFVIMPNHIHAIIIIGEAAGASPRSTLQDIVCAFKSLSQRNCKLSGYDSKLWQSGMYEHIIRNQDDYLNIWTYIDANPSKWTEDEYFASE